MTNNTLKINVIEYFNSEEGRFKTLEEIGEKFGVTRQYASKILLDEGLSPRRRQRDKRIFKLKENALELVQVLTVDTTSEEIANHLDIKPSQVTDVVSSLGISLHNLSIFRKLDHCLDIYKELEKEHTQRQVATDTGYNPNYIGQQLKWSREMFAPEFFDGKDYTVFNNLPRLNDLAKDCDLYEEYLDNANMLEKLNYINQISKLNSDNFSEYFPKPIGYYIVKVLQEYLGITENNFTHGEEVLLIDFCYEENVFDTLDYNLIEEQREQEEEIEQPLEEVKELPEEE